MIASPPATGLPSSSKPVEPKKTLARKELSTASNYSETEDAQSGTGNASELVRKALNGFRNSPALANDKVVDKFKVIVADPDRLMKLAENTLADKSSGSDVLRAKDGLLALLGKTAGELVKECQVEQINKLLSERVFPLLRSDQSLHIRARAVWVFAELRSHLRKRNDRQLSMTELVKATKSLAKIKQNPDKVLISSRKVNWTMIFVGQALLSTPKSEPTKFGSKLFDLLLELIEGPAELADKALDVLSDVLNCDSHPWKSIEDSSGGSLIEAAESLTDLRTGYFSGQFERPAASHREADITYSL